MRTKSSQLYRVVLAIVTALVVLLPAQSVSAAATNITTTPVSLNLPIKPGASKTSTLQILNNGTQPQAINVVLQTFGAYGGQGDASIKPFDKNDPAPSYVHFSETSFVAQPGVWKPITMTVKLPATAQLGYYYAVIFKPVIPSASGQNLNVLTASNAVLVLVDTQSANEQRQLKLVSFDATKKLYDYLPVTFNVTVHNTGNIYLPPVGQIFVTRDSEFHKILATVDVNTGRGNILPDSNRSFSAQWSQGFPVYTTKMVNGKAVTDASGQPVQQLKWDFSQLRKFRFGKYYAHLVLVYNNGKRDVPIESSLSFWVIPWVSLAVLLVLALIVLAGIVLIFWLFFRGGRRVFGSSSRHKSYRRR